MIWTGGLPPFTFQSVPNLWMASLSWALCLCAVAQCDGTRYRYRVFSEVDVTYGVIYGANVGSSGSNEELDMDGSSSDDDDDDDDEEQVFPEAWSDGDDE